MAGFSDSQPGIFEFFAEAAMLTLGVCGPYKLFVASAPLRAAGEEFVSRGHLGSSSRLVKLSRGGERFPSLARLMRVGLQSPGAGEAGVFALAVRSGFSV